MERQGSDGFVMICCRNQILHGCLASVASLAPACALAGGDMTAQGMAWVPRVVSDFPALGVAAMDTLSGMVDAAGTGLDELVRWLESSALGVSNWILLLGAVLLISGAAALIWTRRKVSESAAASKQDPHFTARAASANPVDNAVDGSGQQWRGNMMEIRRSFAEVTAGMRDNSEAIACAAAEIAASIREMGAQAEARAARLEQTLARIEKLVVNKLRDDDQRRNAVPAGAASSDAAPNELATAVQATLLAQQLLKLGTQQQGGNVDAIAATAAALRGQADELAKGAARLNDVAARGVGACAAPSPQDNRLPNGPAGDADGLEHILIPDVALSKEEINDLIMETWHQSGNRGPAPKVQGGNI
jgi:methyl-accepting chemotaxis protein